LLAALSRRIEVLETENQFRTTTQAVAVEGDLLSANEVMRRSRRDRATVVARDGTTARVAHARHWHAVDLEVRGTAADDLSAVRGGVT
jgi:hypothetical protein